MSTETRIRKRQSLEELNELIIDSIQDIKGQNILKLDLRHLDDAPTDYFIICEGTSTTQVKAISDSVYKKVKDNTGHAPLHHEGQLSAHWICLDFFDVVVHVFYPETRKFYQLEDLWSDALFTEIENL
ncbi:MAG: ribosome silencing factor [Saprospirales bacterium]|nr:ribosome silencing factor [Saprospirales bacterium]MBK8491608.1 ribosome silencing factor [Saprospirales bacterium]